MIIDEIKTDILLSEVGALNSYDPKSIFGMLKYYLLEILITHKNYRWHDLLKNPKDLPREELIFALIEAENKLYKSRITFYAIGYFKGKEWHFDYANAKFKKVYAWRYIEPLAKVDEVEICRYERFTL